MYLYCITDNLFIKIQDNILILYDRKSIYKNKKENLSK